MMKARDLKPGDEVAVDVGAVNGYGKKHVIDRAHFSEDGTKVWFDTFLGGTTLVVPADSPVIRGVVVVDREHLH